jgi:hypothetical protein
MAAWFSWGRMQDSNSISVLHCGNQDRTVSNHFSPLLALVPLKAYR